MGLPGWSALGKKVVRTILISRRTYATSSGTCNGGGRVRAEQAVWAVPTAQAMPEAFLGLIMVDPWAQGPDAENQGVPLYYGEYSP